MFKPMYKFAQFFILLLIIALAVSSCNKKEGAGDDKKNTASEFVKNEAGGQKVTLKMVPKVGDKFHYKMVAKTFSTENSPATGNQDITSEQTMTYYYTQDVAEISASGYITFKMKYDSIVIVEKAMSKDSTLQQTYSSNVKDSISSKLDYIQYNALAGQEFKFRVSPKGEIAEVIELEQIHDKIFKALGDTLSAEDKAKIKESMGSDALKSIIQNQFQKFPETDVFKDSTWNFSSETTLSVFPIKNILSYKLLDVKTDKTTQITIDATLGIEFIQKEAKQMGMTIKLQNEEAGGKGTVVFDLSKGCVIRKETNTNINMDLKLSAKGQTANSKQTLKTNLLVELL